MYTLVGYDKDNDTYIEYESYPSFGKAYDKAIELRKKIEKGELKNEANGEPIDWIEIYKNYNFTFDEQRLCVI